MAFNIDAFRGRGIVRTGNRLSPEEAKKLRERLEHEFDKESGGIITINMDWESDWDDIGE